MKPFTLIMWGKSPPYYYGNDFHTVQEAQSKANTVNLPNCIICEPATRTIIFQSYETPATDAGVPSQARGLLRSDCDETGYSGESAKGLDPGSAGSGAVE